MFVPGGTFSVLLMSVWNRLIDLLNVKIAEWVNGVDLLCNSPKIGTVRETAVQLSKAGGHFLSSLEIILSRNSELINCKPDLVDTCNESSIAAVTGHKVGGC
jgi:hypothetical protein